MYKIYINYSADRIMKVCGEDAEVLLGGITADEEFNCSKIRMDDGTVYYTRDRLSDTRHTGFYTFDNLFGAECSVKTTHVMDITRRHVVSYHKVFNWDVMDEGKFNILHPKVLFRTSSADNPGTRIIL